MMKTISISSASELLDDNQNTKNFLNTSCRMSSSIVFSVRKQRADLIQTRSASSHQTYQRCGVPVNPFTSCPDDHSLSIPWMLLFQALLPHRTSWSSDWLGWSVVEICASVLRFSALRLVMWDSVAGRGAWLNRLVWAFLFSNFQFTWICSCTR